MPEESRPNLYKVLTIQNVIEETEDFRTFEFKEGHQIVYEPGQFLTLVQSGSHGEIRRSYSITSAPALREPLSIGVKRVPNGVFSRRLVDQARPGDFIYTTGAAGFFRLPDDIRSFSTLFFFAAGSGIAPVYSMIKTVLQQQPGIRVYLIYSNQSVRSTAFYRQLRQMESRYRENLRIHFLFSTLFDLKRARLNRDLLLEFLTTDQFDRDRTFFYTCGPAAYMRMIQFHLQEQGFPRDRMKKEDFNPYHTVVPRSRPPDTGAHEVVLKVNADVFRFTVNYPDSILKAARKQNISLPYSCETGKCGSCAARCLKGTVWLSYNEVLTEKELAAGLTLTCVGHPLNGDVVLEIGQL